jgi:hypothetical protein
MHAGMRQDRRAVAVLTRRRLIQTGIAGTALLAVGGTVLGWATLGYHLEPGEWAIGLSVKEFCVVRALVDTMVPGGGKLKPGVELGVPQRIDEEVWAADDGMRSDVRNILQFIEHVPPVYGHFGRFTSLDRTAREKVLRSLMASSQTIFVQAATAVKELVYLYYYSHDETWDALGYPGPLVDYNKPPASALRYQQLIATRKAGKS